LKWTNARVKKRWFGRTLIYSDRRFTYEEAQDILEGADGDFQEELRTINEMAIMLRDNA
jgi:ribonuclease R